jgi:hypothetical protein
VGFMYMGRINGIHLYKHGISRTYIHLDDAGGCYVPLGKGCYARADWEKELALLEDLLKTLGANLETRYDENFVRHERQTLQKKGIALLTIEIAPGDFAIH